MPAQRYLNISKCIITLFADIQHWAISAPSLLSSRLVINKKWRADKKKKRSKKRKTCWKMENSTEFPTFQHSKQTTSYYYLSLTTKRVHCPAKPSHLTSLPQAVKRVG